MEYKLGGKSFSWLFQRISAVFLAVTMLLHFHFFIKRFIASGGVNYNDLISRLSNPMFKLLEIAFFFFALSHGLNGIWMLVENFIHNHRYQRFLYIFLWLLGIAAFSFITLTIVSL